MTTNQQPSDRLITQTAQALAITANPPEPWAGLGVERREYWRDVAAGEHGVPGCLSLVTVTRGIWASTVGRVVAIQADAGGDRFYVVALLGMPDEELQFLHGSEVALYLDAS